MINAIAKATLLAQLLQLMVVVLGQSPCPTTFWYNRDPETNETSGYVQILSPSKENPSRLNITLSHNVALSTYNVGIELAHTAEESIMALEQSMPIMFRLSFPSDLPIPMLTSILFNSVTICTGPPAVGPIVSTIALNNELHLSGKDGKKNLTFVSIPPAISLNQPNNLDCGRGLPISLVAGGSEVSPGQWPWVVAIFIVKIEFIFQCTGTLVTNKHVISAAQCFHMNNTSLPAENFVVSVGRYDLRDWRQNGSVNSDVAEYRIHPDYSYVSSDADLAVAILHNKVEYGPLIRPCCLWSWSADLNILRGKYGTVVGWGFNELGEYNSEPKRITATIVSQEECLRSKEKYAALTSNRTFCAGHAPGNGSYACKGDRGSGLLIYERETDRFYLRGVVSKTIADTTPCDENEFTIFVDVAKHLNWIHRQMTEYYV